MSLRAVLFDLDGTLVDSAPDLHYALNLLLKQHGKPSVPLALARPHASRGARGMLQVGFNLTPEHADFVPLREAFLDLYEANLCRETRLFDGMAQVLDEIEARQLRWGIVTNKAARFTVPLLRTLGLSERAAVVMSGDSAARAKPHPDLLLGAARQLEIEPHYCMYIGDDQRDCDAAKASGMSMVVARYGYVGTDSHPNTWRADHWIDAPAELIACLSSRT